MVSPEAVVRVSGLLSAVLTAGSGSACVYPSKFQHAVKLWLTNQKEASAGCSAMSNI